MTVLEAYRRVTKWTDERCDPFQRTIFSDGIDFRAMCFAAAANLSGKLRKAANDDDLLDCVEGYELKIQAGETFEVELGLECDILLRELKQDGNAKHAA